MKEVILRRAEGEEKKEKKNREIRCKELKKRERETESHRLGKSQKRKRRGCRNGKAMTP